MELFKETVYSGFSLQNFTKVRDALSAGNVWYTTRVRNQAESLFGAGSAFGGMGNAGMNPDYTRQYEVLVKRKDAEKARYLIRGISMEGL